MNFENLKCLHVLLLLEGGIDVSSFLLEPFVLNLTECASSYPRDMPYSSSVLCRGGPRVFPEGVVGR